MDTFRGAALDMGKVLRIGAHLQQGAGPDPPGQLGIFYFIVEGTQSTCSCNAPHEVRVPNPAVVE